MLGVKSIREPIKGDFAKKILLEIVEKTLKDSNNKCKSKKEINVKWKLEK